MLLSGPFEKFVEASPVTVMMRGIIENLFHPERLNRLFEENAVTQYTRTLPFSTVAEVMGDVVFNVSPSIGASLQERVDSLPVSTRAFYLKLNGIEPDVAAVLTRDSAQQLAPVIRKLANASGAIQRVLTRGTATAATRTQHFVDTLSLDSTIAADRPSPSVGEYRLKLSKPNLAHGTTA